jgi:hypothetical protein
LSHCCTGCEKLISSCHSIAEILLELAVGFLKILIGLKIIAKLPILTSKTKYLTSLHYPSENLIPFFAPTQNNEIDLTEDVASWISITIIID